MSNEGRKPNGSPYSQVRLRSSELQKPFVPLINSLDRKAIDGTIKSEPRDSESRNCPDRSSPNNKLWTNKVSIIVREFDSRFEYEKPKLLESMADPESERVA
jgi:hypothetical protein